MKRVAGSNSLPELELESEKVDEIEDGKFPLSGFTTSIDAQEVNQPSSNVIVNWGAAIPGVVHFLRCANCLQIPKSRSKHFVCDAGHILCKKCAKIVPCCIYNWQWDGPICRKPFIKVRPPLMFKQIVESLERATPVEEESLKSGRAPVADVPLEEESGMHCPQNEEETVAEAQPNEEENVDVAGIEEEDKDADTQRGEEENMTNVDLEDEGKEDEAQPEEEEKGTEVLVLPAEEGNVQPGEKETVAEAPSEEEERFQPNYEENGIEPQPDEVEQVLTAKKGPKDKAGGERKLVNCGTDQNIDVSGQMEKLKKMITQFVYALLIVVTLLVILTPYFWF